MTTDIIIYKFCAGPGLKPNEFECPENKGMHRVLDGPDTRPYCGIVNWRCSKCFAKHQWLVRNKNKK